MEISILFTIFLIIILLGRLFFQGELIRLIEKVRTLVSSSVSYDCNNDLSQWVEKLFLIELYLLNTVGLYNAERTAQTTLNQLNNSKLEG